MAVRRVVLAVLGLTIAATVVVAQQFGGRGRNRGRDPLPNASYDGRYTFFRVRFEPYTGGRDLKWDHDYPRAESHFMKILRELTTIKPRFDGGNIYSFDEPEMFKYPIAYVSEPGYWTLTEAEAVSLRNYLLKGGFVIFDDFAGGDDWANFEARMREVLPNANLVRLEASHPIFDSFFHIEEKTLHMEHPYYKQYLAEFYGIYEDNDPGKRLIAIINFNNDVGDYMEWSDEGFLPIDLSNEAYKLSVNYVVYALTH